MALEDSKVEHALVWSENRALKCQICAKPVYKRDNWLMFHHPPKVAFIAFMCRNCYGEWRRGEHDRAL